MFHIYVLVAVLLIQSVSYYWFYKKGKKGWRYFLFAILVLLCLIVLPMTFIFTQNDNTPEGGHLRCGTVDVMFFHFFFIYGIGGLVIIHLGYYIWNYFSKK